MSEISYDQVPYAIRDDLIAAQRRCWEGLARAGTWHDGARRVAIAAETRNARNCDYCQAQKAALSPNAVAGSHAGLGELSDVEVDAVHRIASDPARLSKAWYEENKAEGLGDEPYVELVSLVAIVTIVDSFTFALGLPDHPLPTPVPGAPTRYRSPGAKVQAAWVPIVEPRDMTESDGDLYPSARVGYIQRAISAVPDSKWAYWDLASCHYLPMEEIPRWDTNARAIDRTQIELIAGRVSALHQCLY
ncbi:MAG: hypothetical protein GKS00_22655 [Alphaproteobacteria bacterium]|nr:hypothetical protein [Alphaproteobacteria bacterium]